MAASLVETDVSSISKVDQYFHKPVETQSYELSEALEALKADTSNAAALAEYQANLPNIILHVMPNLLSIKVIKDLAMSIIGNMCVNMSFTEVMYGYCTYYSG